MPITTLNFYYGCVICEQRITPWTSIDTYLLLVLHITLLANFKAADVTNIQRIRVPRHIIMVYKVNMGQTIDLKHLHASVVSI